NCCAVSSRGSSTDVLPSLRATSRQYVGRYAIPHPGRKAVAIEKSVDGALGRSFDPRESADQALANLSRHPGGVLALDVQDVVLDLDRQHVRIVTGPPTSVRQPLYPTLLAAIEDFVARLAGDPKPPAQIRHLLAG